MTMIALNYIVPGGILSICGFVPWEDFVHRWICPMGGFCPWEDFVPGRILSMGGFCPWEHFVHDG